MASSEWSQKDRCIATVSRAIPSRNYFNGPHKIWVSGITKLWCSQLNCGEIFFKQTKILPRKRQRQNAKITWKERKGMQECDARRLKGWTVFVSVLKPEVAQLFEFKMVWTSLGKENVNTSWRFLSQDPHMQMKSQMDVVHMKRKCVFPEESTKLRKKRKTKICLTFRHIVLVSQMRKNPNLLIQKHFLSRNNLKRIPKKDLSELHVKKSRLLSTEGV